MKVASEGVAGAAGELPHADTIQRLFGRHDITSVRAQIGGAAASASQMIGANAYTQGDRVGFAVSPDLRTAAHEATHVVQQRAGHAPPAGLDTPGDPLEDHADRVSDAVVAGRSADHLLDQVTETPASAVQRDSVQRDGDKPQKVGATNPIYVNDNRLPLIIAIMDRIGVTVLPQPHPRLRWKDDRRAKEALALAISAYIRAAPDVTLKRMMMLSYPADLFELVDQARRGPAGARFDAVKLAVATAFDEPLVASITRMGTRAVVQLDANPGKQIPAASLVGSCPLDGVIAELLVDKSLVDHAPARKGAEDDTGGKPFLGPLRGVTYEWQGSKDPNLWNWLKATSPPDATVEEVASTFDDPEQAYRIAASPPYFGIPFEIARDVDEARVHAPAGVRAKLDTGPGPRVADPVKLASSVVADEAAQAQAPALPQDDPPPARTLDRVQLQIGFMNRQLAPWHANDPLAGAILFVERRRAEFARDPKAAQRWAAALAAQERTLFAASSELTELLDDVARTGAKPADAPGLLPVMRVIDAYAHAGAVAHLHAEAPAALAEARRLKTLLPLALTEDRIRNARGEVTRQRQTEAEAGATEPNADKTPVDVDDQLRRAADLRLQAAHGDELDPDAVEQLSVDASETALRARLVTLATQAHAVMRRADDVGLDQGPYPGGSWSVHMVSAVILEKINGPAGQAPTDRNDHTGGGWHEQLDAARRYVGPRKGQTGDQTLVAQRREAIKRVSAQLDRFAQELNIGEYLRWAYARIADEQLRSLIRNMALQIGIAVVTGEIIGAVGAAVRGISLAGEIGAELREASLLYKGAEILATAGANTATQGALGGEMTARSLAENALGIVLTSAALKPFQGLLHDSAAVEAEIQRWGGSAGRIGKAAAELVIDTGASIGATGVAHAVTHGGEMGQGGAEAWVTMGLAIAASKFVHQRTQGMQHRIVEVSRELKTRSFDKLFDRVTALEKRSNPKDGQRPSPEQAIELLAERHELLVEEQRLYQANPAAKQALVEARTDLAATGAQFADVPLQLAHLSPIVEGHVYEGTATEIEHAFHAADATGVPLTREWRPEQGGWRVTSGDRVIEIHERGARLRAEAESRGAQEVPNSNFTGKAPAGQTRRKIDLKEVQHHARSAATILDGLENKYFSYDHDVLVVSVGHQWCWIGFEVVDAMPDVAKHTYRHGANKAWIEISEQARPEDLTRAIAHELSEIVTLMESRFRSVGDPAALIKGSKSTDLSHHDIGRKAELQVLLYELENQPARRADILEEISALVDHLGFDMKTIGKDARAKSVFGEEIVKRLDQRVARKRTWVTKNQLKIRDRYSPGAKEWQFFIDAPLPNGKEHQMAYGHCEIDPAGQPISGPTYSLEKRITIDGEEVRVTIGDGAMPESLTDLVIAEGNAYFKKRFKHPPIELPGLLVDDNRTIFQRAYLAELDANTPPDSAKISALRKTPFGQARIRAGYDKLEVLPFTHMEHIIYGDPPRVREVPMKVEAIARKK